MLVEQYVQPYPGQRILDLGCGTSRILTFLPEDIEYVGYDESEAYINSARHYFGQRGSWKIQPLDQLEPSERGSFDLVMAIGVIHHLDDSSATTMLQFARSALAPSGRFLSTDPCFTDQQSYLARFLVGMDRGRFVRDADQYRALLATTFPNGLTEIRQDLLRFPYTHIVMSAEP
jgi:cyclopropane fatty-acyl-phospholipid synthase-like methyltransferase